MNIIEQSNETRKLGDIASFMNGYAFKPEDWSDTGVPIIRIQDLTGSSYQANRYSGTYDKRYEVNSGDVLISWSASLGIYVWVGEKAVLNQHIFKVIFDKENVNKSFFIHQVRHILENASGQAHGATMKHLTRPVFNALPFRLPDAVKQKEIADILDSISNMIELRQKILSKLDQLAKSRFIEMFGSGQFPTKTIKSICKIVTDGTHQPPHFTDTGIPFLFVSNIVDNTLTYETSKFISEQDYIELIKHTPIEYGDILLSIVGSYGNPAIVRSSKRFCFQRHLAYLKPDKGCVMPEFLHAAFLSSDVKEQIERRVKGIAQKTLNLSGLKSIEVPLPPLSLQNEFASFIEQLDKSKLADQTDGVAA